MRGTLSGPLERLPREEVDCLGEVGRWKCGSHVRSVGAWLRREEVAGPSLQFSFVSQCTFDRLVRPGAPAVAGWAGARRRMARLVRREAQGRHCAAGVVWIRNISRKILYILQSSRFQFGLGDLD